MRCPIDRKLTETYSVGILQARALRTHRINCGPRAFSTVIIIIVFECSIIIGW